MSIPRDLKVDIPGHGDRQDQRRVRARRPAPDASRRQEAVRQDRQAFRSTTSSTSNFGGFRRRSTTSTASTSTSTATTSTTTRRGEHYATIDVEPGYQKLMGQDALDYVRYRHGDNDLVRAARQQDFLRQAENAAGVARLLADRRSASCCRCSRRYSASTSRCARTSRCCRCSSSRSSWRQEPESARSASRPTTRRTRARLEPVRRQAPTQTVYRVPRRAEALQEAAPRPARPPGDRKPGKPRSEAARDRAGPRGRADRGRGPGRSIADPKLDFPFYFPTSA